MQRYYDTRSKFKIALELAINHYVPNTANTSVQSASSSPSNTNQPITCEIFLNPIFLRTLEHLYIDVHSECLEEEERIQLQQAGFILEQDEDKQLSPSAVRNLYFVLVDFLEFWRETIYLPEYLQYVYSGVVSNPPTVEQLMTISIYRNEMNARIQTAIGIIKPITLVNRDKQNIVSSYYLVFLTTIMNITNFILLYRLEEGE